MDVTKQIERTHNFYGGEGNSIASTIASNKSLNFAEGASINKPVKTGTITRLPYIVRFQGTVGLFGAENQFYEFNLNVEDYGDGFVQEDLWQQASIGPCLGTDPYYNCGFVDPDRDFEIVNTYIPASISDNLARLNSPVFSVRVLDNQTGNIYIDNWLDFSLYNRTKTPRPDNVLVANKRDKFYVGFHARNTRRLDYDIEVRIGEIYKNKYELTDEELSIYKFAD